jgi:fatty acid desaturase
MAWAWALLLGHAALAAACAARGAFVLPLCVSMGPFYNGWLFFLCNATQHVGLSPHVPDFRRNSRTFALHPALAFVYWHMNFHIEHHMYANVPCYNLPALHVEIDVANPQAWLRLGNLHQQAGRDEEAIDAYRRAARGRAPGSARGSRAPRSSRPRLRAARRRCCSR